MRTQSSTETKPTAFGYDITIAINIFLDLNILIYEKYIFKIVNWILFSNKRGSKKYKKIKYDNPTRASNRSKKKKTVWK